MRRWVLTHSHTEIGRWVLIHTHTKMRRWVLTHSRTQIRRWFLTHSLKWEGEFTVTHSPTFIYMCKWVYLLVLYINSLSPSVRPSVTTGRREKWREKDKTTVGWRAFEVLKPRSWDPGPETSRRGPETQVLRSRFWNLALRSWNPGPESVRALLIGWSN